MEKSAFANHLFWTSILSGTRTSMEGMSDLQKIHEKRINRLRKTQELVVNTLTLEKTIAYSATPRFLCAAFHCALCGVTPPEVP